MIVLCWNDNILENASVIHNFYLQEIRRHIIIILKIIIVINKSDFENSNSTTDRLKLTPNEWF